MTTTCLEPIPVLDALIAGLGVTRQGLDAKCEGALRAVGGRAAQYLSAVAQSSSRRRKRVETLAASISASQVPRPDALLLCHEALLLAATAQTSEDNPSLVYALTLLGPTIVNELVRVAIVNRKKPLQCLRALEMIEHLGGVSVGGGQFEVALLMRSESPAVRELAAKLFCRPRPNP